MILANHFVCKTDAIDYDLTDSIFSNLVIIYVVIWLTAFPGRINKSTERLKTILSVSPILKVLAPLLKKVGFYKRGKQIKPIQTKIFSPKRKKTMCKDLILACCKLFIAEVLIVSLRRQ